MKKIIHILAMLSLGTYSSVTPTEPRSTSTSVLNERYVDLYNKTVDKYPEASKAFSSDMGKNVLETFLSSQESTYEVKKGLFESLLADESTESQFLLNFLIESLKASVVEPAKNPLVTFFRNYAQKTTKAAKKGKTPLLTAFEKALGSPSLQELLLAKPDFFADRLKNFFTRTLTTFSNSVPVEYWIDSYLDNRMRSNNATVVQLFNTVLETNDGFLGKIRKQLFEKALGSPSLHELLLTQPQLLKGGLEKFFTKILTTFPDSMVVQEWMDAYITNKMTSQKPNTLAQLFDTVLQPDVRSLFKISRQLNDRILEYIYTQFEEPYRKIVQQIMGNGTDPRKFLVALDHLATLCSDAPQANKETAFSALDKDAQRWFCQIYIKEASLKNEPQKGNQSSHLATFLQNLRSSNSPQLDSVMITLAHEISIILNNPQSNFDLEPVINILRSNNFATKYPKEFKEIAEACFDNVVTQDKSHNLPLSQTNKKLTLVETTLREVANMGKAKTRGLRIWLREYCTLSKIRVRIRSLGKDDTKRYNTCMELAKSLRPPSTLSTREVCKDIGTILQGIKGNTSDSDQPNTLIRMLQSIGEVTPDIVSEAITNRLKGTIHRAFFISTLDWKSSTQNADITLPEGSDTIPDPLSTISATSAPHTDQQEPITTATKITPSQKKQPSNDQSSEEQRRHQKEEEEKKEEQQQDNDRLKQGTTEECGEEAGER